MSIRDAGTTIRPSSTALLTIDSEDRFANWNEKRGLSEINIGYNENPYNFTLIRNAPLVNGYMTRLAVSEVVFPWSIPNINNKTNIINFQYQTIPDGEITTTYFALNTGFYTPSQLASAMYDAINFIQAGIISSFSYGDDKLPRFTYTCNTGASVAFLPMLSNQQATIVPGEPPTNLYPYANTTKQLFDVLGFTGKNTTLQTGATTGQATFAQAVRYIDIVSPQLTANQGLPDSTSQTIARTALCRLYVSDSNNSILNVSSPSFAPPGTQPFVIYRQFQNPKEIAWNAIMPITGRIQFQVYDDNGELLTPSEFVLVSSGSGSTFSDYSAYADWSLSLLLTEN